MFFGHKRIGYVEVGRLMWSFTHGIEIALFPRRNAKNGELRFHLNVGFSFDLPKPYYGRPPFSFAYPSELWTGRPLEVVAWRRGSFFAWCNWVRG